MGRGQATKGRGRQQQIEIAPLDDRGPVTRQPNVYANSIALYQLKEEFYALRPTILWWSPPGEDGLISRFGGRVLDIVCSSPDTSAVYSPRHVHRFQTIVPTTKAKAATLQSTLRANAFVRTPSSVLKSPDVDLKDGELLVDGEGKLPAAHEVNAGNVLVKEAFKKSDGAKNEGDYSEIIALCEEGIKSERNAGQRGLCAETVAVGPTIVAASGSPTWATSRRP